MGLSVSVCFQQLKNEAAIASIEKEYSVGEARKPENRGKNRYRDVSPCEFLIIRLLKVSLRVTISLSSVHYK